MEFRFFSLIWLFLSAAALAGETPGWDESVQAFAQTVPITLAAQAGLGYSTLVWGDPKTLNYGYARAYADLRTAGIVNGGDLGLELAPLPFLVVTGGKTIDSRIAKIPGMQCDSSDCEGFLNSWYFNPKLGLGAGDFFGELEFQEDFFDTRGNLALPAADENSLVMISPTGGRRTQWRGLAGYKITDIWSAGVFFDFASSRNQPPGSDTEILFLKHQLGLWSWLVGTGRLNAPETGGVSSQFLVNVVWTPSERIGLGL